MKPTILLAFCVLSFLAIACSVPKYQSTFPSYRQAIVRGELKEALASYESQAREAEKNAQGSLFPQQYWREAVEAYRLAETQPDIPGNCRKQSHMAKRVSR
jgi:collagenase-like PrtC family protease